MTLTALSFRLLDLINQAGVVGATTDELAAWMGLSTSTLRVHIRALYLQKKIQRSPLARSGDVWIIKEAPCPALSN